MYIFFNFFRCIIGISIRRRLHILSALVPRSTFSLYSSLLLPLSLFSLLITKKKSKVGSSSSPLRLSLSVCLSLSLSHSLPPLHETSRSVPLHGWRSLMDIRSVAGEGEEAAASSGATPEMP
ncbi:hypothetical protein HPP92_019788 [Vanilla planifolia]|uniref:Uncharacterized protein n=1 Tax=Vanilla planifolia TaxID=51239 RepID=A0A835UHW2_VANPL|nr:hypothetical protein HPP92_019788 [Vanilla planifolia]